MNTYITYFDANYLVKGLAMIGSLRRHDPECTVHVVCLDDETLHTLRSLALPGVAPLPLRLFEADDVALNQAKGNRSRVEYYWTMTPTLILRLLDQQPLGSVVTYVDADLYFFSTPQAIFDEMGTGSVYIHGHNFPAPYKELEVNGIFNVGLLCFRHDAEGRKVLSWWREQCLAWCYDRREDGKMGDQKYLESFQSLSPAVVVAVNPGVGVAPWNQIGYRVDAEHGVPRVDEHAVVFYHYHAAAFLAPGCLVLNTDPFYKCTLDMQRLFAIPYLHALHESLALVRVVAPDFAKGFKPNGLTTGVCALIERGLEASFAEAYPVRVQLDDNHMLCAGPQLAEYAALTAALRPGLHWEGDYPDWQSATAAAGGYDAEAIFTKVRQAARDVRDGKALWERDAVLFHEPQCNWPLLAGLFQVACAHNGHLHVLDFGGALGSTFMQHRHELSRLPVCTWTVVEQEHVVRCGQKEFTTPIMRFCQTVEQALASTAINILLLSSVLQYVEKPYALLKTMAQTGLPILIDRTPMLATGERITVQHVPPEIYTASYACRWLDQRRVDGILRQHGYSVSPYFQSTVDAENFMGVFATREVPMPHETTTHDAHSDHASPSPKTVLEEGKTRLRIMQPDDFYSNYLDDFYTKHPHLCRADYKTQTNALFEDGFSAVHAVTPYLTNLGCEVDYFVYNALPLQQAWARQHGIPMPPAGTPWEEALLRRRIEWFKPDVLYVGDTVRYDASFIDSLSYRPRCILGWRAADVPITTDWTGYDAILSALPNMLELAPKLGARQGVLFYPGMPVWIAKALTTIPQDTDVVFVGGINLNQHARRHHLLDVLSRAATEHGFSFGLHLSCAEQFITPAMRPHLRPPVFGLAMHKALRRGKIVFDVQGGIGILLPNGKRSVDLAAGYTANMRLFEGTGGGSLVLTDALPHLNQLFEPEKELAVFTNETDMVAQIIYYLAHEQERATIAQAGMDKCLRSYPMHFQAKAFLNICKDCLARTHTV